MRILLVEDDHLLANTMLDMLREEPNTVDWVDDGRQALHALAEEHFDLAILDLTLPRVDGLDIVRQVRQQGNDTPIIILTARADLEEKLQGLDAGADDYLTKPFSPRELLARVAAVMRRIRPVLAGETIAVGDIVLDPVAHKVERRGRMLQLGPTEYRLLKFFMESPGRVFSRGQLLDGVWGTGSDIELRTVDVHIRRLRKAIEIEGAKDPVRTVRSAGYSLEA